MILENCINKEDLSLIKVIENSTFVLELLDVILFPNKLTIIKVDRYSKLKMNMLKEIN